jgi:hypothetical protein
VPVCARFLNDSVAVEPGLARLDETPELGDLAKQ